MVDCVYQVYEYLGNYGGESVSYYERQSINGTTMEFFPGNVANIDYQVRPYENGYWCEYEVSTLAGEKVAINRWINQYDNEHLAKADTLSRAIDKVARFKQDAVCKVSNQDATAVLKGLEKRGEKEREEQPAVL